MSGMLGFWKRCQQVAERETRVVTLPTPMEGLPAGAYAFVEFYCSDPKCDCRRVLIQIWPADRPQTILASINFGWETEDYYTEWFHGNRDEARQARGAALDPLNPQSPVAPALLALFKSVIREDPGYVARLARHYQLFRSGTNPPKNGKPGRPK